MVVTTNLHLDLGIVRGNKFPLKRIIANIPAGVTLSEAYLTLKAAYTDADPGLFQKHITTANVSGVGRIENDGTSGTGELRFDLTEADTEAMVADTPYFFDIKLVDSGGYLLTVERGTTSAVNWVTQST